MAAISDGEGAILVSHTDERSASLLILIAGPSSAESMMYEMSNAIVAGGGICRVVVDTVRIEEEAVWSDVSILVSFGVACGEQAISKAARLRAIVSPMLGYEWIDLAAATACGIAVVNGEVAENRESMAEATILLMLALTYRLLETATAATSSGGSELSRHMLRGKTIGIVGSGGIARAVIKRLKGWDVELLVSSRTASIPIDEMPFVPLTGLLMAADIVVVLTSLTATTRHLINDASIALMKPGALLVNTARGAIIEEGALIKALEDGRLGGAALDVFENEPLSKSHVLHRFPNVILTNHCIGHTVESRLAALSRAVENVLALCEGILPESCRNPQVATAWCERYAVAAT